MSTSFPPHEPGKRYNLKSALAMYWRTIALYWLCFLIGTLVIGLAATSLPELVESKDPTYPLVWLGIALVGGVITFSFTFVKDRRRVKWVRTSESDGLEWYSDRRVWSRRWKEIHKLNFSSPHLPQSGGALGLCYQTMTITFVDGVQICLKSWNCASLWYVPFRDYVDQKHAQATSMMEGVFTRTARPQPVTANEVTTFGPLSVLDNGVEWDGVLHPWDQIEVCAIQDEDFLIIQSVNGDEFFKRLADLGDWHTAIARLDAAAPRMTALRPVDAPAPESCSPAPSRRQLTTGSKLFYESTK
jgi:hypothetical protein